MAPSAKALSAALHNAVKQIFKSDRALLTVNNVRKTAADDLDLDPDFFKSEVWKEKSKNIITTYSNELMEKEEGSSDSAPEAKPTLVKKEKTPAPKNGKKRTSMSKNSRPSKRQKKEETPDLSEDVSLSDVESEVSNPPKIQKGKRASSAPKRKVKRKDESDSDSVKSEESEEETKPKIRPVAKVRSLQGSVGPKRESVEDQLKDEGSSDEEGSKARLKKQEDSESELSDIPSEKPKLKRERSIKVEIKKPADSESELSDLKDETPESKFLNSPRIKKADNDESEMSDVIDETPKPKRQRKSKSEMASSKANLKSTSSNKVKSKTKAKPKPPPADLAPEEAELKTLQGQLVKCGIKKIWGIYLKQFGDDTKAKIRHLKEMLKDAGMTGRFSNEKAAEIKEMRELAADLEAVKEGEEKWGMGSGRRSRGSVKSGKTKYKLGSDEDEDVDGSGEGSDSDVVEKEGGNSRSRSRSVKAKDKVAMRKQDLAFLGSEEDSD